jgi:hypothetical protein
MTAQHWRTLRLKLIQSGVSNPMALPTAHILLDMTEALILESMVSDDPKEDQRQRDRFISTLYKPEVVKREGLPDGWVEPPPGFDDDEANEAAFDAAAAMAR